jgi:hypothetical protein
MKKAPLLHSVILIIVSLLVIAPETLAAPKKKKALIVCSAADGSVKAREKKCAKGETIFSTKALIASIQTITGPIGPTGLQGPTGQQGPTGNQGPQGVSGILNLYGDGSDGDITHSSSATYDPTQLYHNIVVNNAATLTLPTGSVVRCTGSLINYGTISVALGAKGGEREVASSATIHTTDPLPHPGNSARAAVNGRIGVDGGQILGGVGGKSPDGTAARALFFPPYYGGGGGGGSGQSGNGGSGGGSAMILCKEGITNYGTIRANGGDGFGINSGTGGGGGGIIILASSTSVDNFGVIQANGGAGDDGAPPTAPGGGGGGGIVRVIAPDYDLSAGTLEVLGGLKGNPGPNFSPGSTARYSGGGGGAGGGDGGGGAGINFNSGYLSAFQGNAGDVHFTATDPLLLVR